METMNGESTPSSPKNVEPEPTAAEEAALEAKAAMFEHKDRLSARPTRKRPTFTAPSADAINYQGLTIYVACRQGNLPVCVLLWGIAAAKQVSLMAADAEGNNPIHYACMAETNETLGFILQQTRGMLDASTRLVDSVNTAGETALLRAMVTASPTIVKTLLDEGSDPLTKDKKGNTVFSICAKASQLWCINMLYEHISAKYGEEKASELLRAKDNEFHGVFDWACDAGDLNTMEWLLRKGVCPTDHDDHGRGALYWATKSRQVHAVRVLVFACGCDPHATNTLDGESPINMAKKFGDDELLNAFYYSGSLCSLFWRPCLPNSYDTAGPLALQNVPRKRKSPSVLARLSGETGEERRSSQGVLLSGDHRSSDAVDEIGPDVEAGHCVITENEIYISALYRDERGYRRSLMHPPKNNTNFVNYAVYAVGVAVGWLLTVVVPFWLWVGLLAALIYAYRKYSGPVEAIKHKAAHQGSRVVFGFVQRLLGAPEKYLGFWMGSIAVAICYVLCNIVKAQLHTNSLQLGGLDAIRDDPSLFWVCVFSLIAVLVLHLYVVWIAVDPGMVQTREKDFDQAMKDSLSTGGTTLTSDAYCRSTLVRKPIRSKYCTGSGFVVARMDHYCVWLNNSVGHGNHKAFYLLLLTHIIANCCFEALVVSTLSREINKGGVGSGWDVASVLFGRKLFYLVIFCAFLMVVTVGLVALFLEQTINITRNQTTNERINASRYAWMTDKAGKPCNRFDKGVVTNVLEFFGVPGFSVNYFDVYAIPDGKDRSNSIDGHRADTLLAQESPVRNKLHQCDHDHDGHRCSDGSHHGSARASNGRASNLSEV